MQIWHWKIKIFNRREAHLKKNDRQPWHSIWTEDENLHVKMWYTTRHQQELMHHNLVDRRNIELHPQIHYDCQLKPQEFENHFRDHSMHIFSHKYMFVPMLMLYHWTEPWRLSDCLSFEGYSKSETEIRKMYWY